MPLRERRSMSGGSQVPSVQRYKGNSRDVKPVGPEAEFRSPVLDVIGRGGGRPLEAELRAAMEARLGASFETVRLHVDARSTDAVGAKAYTVGEEIVVHPDFARLRTTEGRKLLAHELAHVIQQRRGPVNGIPGPGGVRISEPTDGFEQAAQEIAQCASTNLGGPRSEESSATVQPRVDGQAPRPRPVVQRALKDTDLEILDGLEAEAPNARQLPLRDRARLWALGRDLYFAESEPSKEQAGRIRRVCVELSRTRPIRQSEVDHLKSLPEAPDERNFRAVKTALDLRPCDSEFKSELRPLLSRFKRERQNKVVKPRPVIGPVNPDVDFVEEADAARVALNDRLQITFENDEFGNLRENVFRLAYDTSTEDGTAFAPYYKNFFSEITRLTTGPAAGFVWTKVRPGLEKQFARLTSVCKSEGSLGDYKGAASEILAALRAAALGAESIKVPTENKGINPKVLRDLGQSEHLLSQDVDRVDVIDGTKFYVEVKANVDTAIKKHIVTAKNVMYPTEQFWRYKAVKISKDTAQAQTRLDPDGGSPIPDPWVDTTKRPPGKHPRTPKPRDRALALEITDPADWWLFFRGSIEVYAQHGFWLFIGGQRFSPPEMQTMAAHVPADQLPKLAKLNRSGQIDVSRFPTPEDFRRSTDLRPVLPLVP
jgi:hypothetical protein